MKILFNGTIKFVSALLGIAMIACMVYLPTFLDHLGGKQKRIVNIPGLTKWQVNIESYKGKSKNHDYFYAIAKIKDDSIISLILPNNKLLYSNDFITQKHHLVDGENEAFLRLKDSTFYDLKLVKPIK